MKSLYLAMKTFIAILFVLLFSACQSAPIASLKQNIKFKSQPRCVEFSPDSNSMLIGFQGRVEVWKKQNKTFKFSNSIPLHQSCLPKNMKFCSNDTFYIIYSKLKISKYNLAGGLKRNFGLPIIPITDKYSNFSKIVLKSTNDINSIFINTTERLYTLKFYSAEHTSDPQVGIAIFQIGEILDYTFLGDRIFTLSAGLQKNSFVLASLMNRQRSKKVIKKSALGKP